MKLINKETLNTKIVQIFSDEQVKFRSECVIGELKILIVNLSHTK